MNCLPRWGPGSGPPFLQSGAEVVATACPACMLQLTDLLSKGGDPVRVKHVIELFAERLPG